MTSLSPGLFLESIKNLHVIMNCFVIIILIIMNSLI